MHQSRPATALVLALAVLLVLRPPAQAGDGPAERYPEVAKLKGRAIFVLDRSGSMTLGDRLTAATSELERMVDALAPETNFDVFLIDHEVLSLFDSGTCRPTEKVKKSLRAKVEAAAFRNGLTDLATGIVAAIERRPAAVFVLSDGFPTRGELTISKLVPSIVERARPHKIAIHTVQVTGGSHPCEDLVSAKEVLKQLAEATGGTFRALESGAKGARDNLALPPTEGDVLIRCLDRTPKRQDAPPEFEIEVVDPALAKGVFVLEYANDLAVNVRTATDGGVSVDEVLRLPLRCDKNGILHTIDRVRIIQPPPKGVAFERRPAREKEVVQLLTGARPEVIYARNGKEIRRPAMLVKPR